MQLPNKTNILHAGTNHARKRKPIKLQSNLSNFLKHPQRRPTLTSTSISSNESVIRNNVRFRNLIKQLAGEVGERVLGTSMDNGVVGKDIRVVCEVKSG
jgi:hypothetical protein